MTIPDLNLDGFTAKAWFDYIKFESLLHGSSLLLKGRFDGTPKTPERPDNQGFYSVTLHDPSREDVCFLVSELEDPWLKGVEISIDFTPESGHPDWTNQLEQCFLALAARLRVDDRHPTGAGFKTAQSKVGSTPLNVRLARTDEVIVIGHRSTGVNFKLYFKRNDNNRPLPESKWCVRMEITLTSYGLGLFGFGRVSSLQGYSYRSAFAKLFQVVDSVSVRDRADWTPRLKALARRRLKRRWDVVGVHAIAPKGMPVDALHTTVEAAKFRERPGRHQVLPARHYKFHRHQRAHDLIANALRQMDRAMRTERNPGTLTGAAAAFTRC